MSKEAKILIGIAVVVLIGGIALFLKQPTPNAPSAPVDSQSLVRSGSHMTGKADAKVTMVEFGDYQCPACGVAHPIVQRIISEYKDNPNFNFVFRNFPLSTIHPNALISAEAAEAAGEQGKFWEMHDKLYETQEQWSTLANPLDTFASYASALGINVDTFKQSVQQKKFSEIIDADLSDGTALGVNSTPTFYVNGEKVNSYQYEALKAKIEEKLK